RKAKEPGIVGLLGDVIEVLFGRQQQPVSKTVRESLCEAVQLLVRAVVVPGFQRAVNARFEMPLGASKWISADGRRWLGVGRSDSRQREHTGSSNALRYGMAHGASRQGDRRGADRVGDDRTRHGASAGARLARSRRSLVRR